jgi:subtilisin family serine protease
VATIVLVAVIDSKIDTKHPDLIGVVADEYDVVGSPVVAHSHGTAMAGAIAARSKLVALPKVKLLAVRAFQARRKCGAPHSIFSRVSIGLRARTRIINMSFAASRRPVA